MKALYFENDIRKIVALKVASAFNRFAALGRFSPLSYGEIQEPHIPNDRWIKIENQSCGLCGTDLHLMFMKMDPGCYPAALPGISRKFLGHELIGRVIETGSDAGDYAVGDRVGIRIDWPSCFQMEIDPTCPQCASGNYMLCENLGRKPLPLVDTGGGFSPIMVAHKTQPFKIPESIGEDRAVLLEPVASVLHGVYKRKPQPGEKILVIGAGSIGLLTVAVTHALCPEADITCLARYPFQADAATDLGATQAILDGKNLYERMAEATGARYIRGPFNNEILLSGFDVIYDTVGNDTSLQNALRWAKGGGDLVILGINFQPGKIDYTPVWNQELRVTGINCHATEADGRTSFAHAVDLLKRPEFGVERIVTHRFAVGDYKQAVKIFFDKKRHQAIKIVLDHPR